jgi:hypothetical protein
MKYTVKFYNANPSHNRHYSCDNLREAKQQMRETDVQTKLYRDSDEKCLAYCEGNSRVINM